CRRRARKSRLLRHSDFRPLKKRPRPIIVSLFSESSKKLTATSRAPLNQWAWTAVISIAACGPSASKTANATPPREQLTPKALANFSPVVGAQRQPWDHKPDRKNK